MQPSSNRSVSIISGLLTLIVLSGATAAVALRNGWLHVAAEGPIVDAVTARAEPQGAQPSPAGHIARAESSMGLSMGVPQDDVVAYRAKLEEAYLALDDACAQIRSLQTAQAQLASRGDGDRAFAEHDDRRERSGRRQESDDN